jgi:hypothetical protein
MGLELGVAAPAVANHHARILPVAVRVGPACGPPS